MAALTDDRIAEKKMRPVPIKTVREVASGASTVFRNALVGVRDSDGKVEPLSASGTYTQILLSAGRHEAGERGEFLQGAIVEALTDFAADASHNGDEVFGIDDQTVTDAQSASEPVAGTVHSVINGGRVFLDMRGA
ncbi:structural protein [Salinibacter phage M8CRM-1]|uniref:Structural protein n=1 Tax=Salinibacter phage M8CRM-1 TaxID=2681612 RepID=A0A2I6UGM8_9CAUD|nr:virion structural protein [Salinibacter phage M8CRM-1]AUO79148.1 structural protein [Salinibacter phage M8CRM-1]